MTEVVLEPTAMAAGGAALARDAEGRVVFVEGALPGEQVRARITEVRKDFSRAVTVDVLDPSPDRIAPPCAALAAGCGGCTWQHVAPGAQHRLKAAIVVDALRRIGRLAEPPPPAVFPTEGRSLRTTARLAVSAAGRPGHRPRSGSGAIETDECGAAHPRLGELIVAGRFPGATEVLLRVGVAGGERLARVDRLDKPADVPADVVVATRGDRRQPAVHEVVAGRPFRISAGSFFQPGPVAAAALAGAVRAAVGDGLAPGGVLVDAYAGVGLLGSVLGAEHGARVVAIENDPVAVADARSNLADLDGRVIPVNVGKWRAERADVVVADPSRTGLGRPGVGALTAAGAPRLVLVSCDPASLARDSALLAEAGYRLCSVALVDSFPDTFHVETVSRFDRRPGAT
ncbi:MAG TPA: TRAM domain-containing protein [Acidimicrobiales bacterium]|nr:TRAM domain-containing protein [Acidimicrobiales bacterium]